MRTKYKPWAKPYIEEHQEIAITASLINERKEPIYLEIGSGKGQFLLDMAKNNPSLFFVGIERNVTCAGFTAKKLVENEVENARLVWDNAERFLLDVDDNKVNTIFLNFSDPWPKDRHAKRRLPGKAFLAVYEKILVKNGQIEFKTDNRPLFDFAVEQAGEAGWQMNVCTYDLHNDAELSKGNVMTEYEEKFSAKGNPICKYVITVPNS